MQLAKIVLSPKKRKKKNKEEEEDEEYVPETQPPPSAQVEQPHKFFEDKVPKIRSGTPLINLNQMHSIISTPHSRILGHV